MAILDWEGMPIHQAFKADWKSPEILLEGSLGCAKTTVMLDKEIDALLKWPGIPILLFRWTDDAVSTKLKTAFEELLTIRGLTAEWDAKQKRYILPNRSTVFMFGLKAVSAIEQFNKIRGLGVARIAGDQVEEMQRSVAGELRGRLRPDLTSTLHGVRFPFQLTYVANPSGDDFWLSKEFPVDNHIKGRKLYSLSVFDNRHLPQESVDSLVRTFPPEHPKHQTMVLGQRGLNIVGDPIYEGLYDRTFHASEIIDPTAGQLIEAFEFGRHNPTWVIAQRAYRGGLLLLGGMMGKRLMLEQFLPIVNEHREAWFKGITVKSCTTPMGETMHTANGRHTLNGLLRVSGIRAVWKENANAADVVLATVEHIAGMLLRRDETTILVNADESKWLTVSPDGTVKPKPFMGFAFDGGYVWSEHEVSISNKELRQPHEDDEYCNAMRCVENLVLNFCVGRPTQAARDAKRQRANPWGRSPIGPKSTIDWAV